MATIPTQNTVPSEAPRDLKFNSGKIDEFVTSLEHEYKDRFGRCHMTIEGMRWVFEQLMERFKVDVNQAIVAAGYIPMDSFQQGAEITKRNEVLRDETTGEYYRWDGDLPKSVQAGSTPESTGGVGVGKWVGVGDASLRSELKKELVTESVKTDKLEVTGNEITVGGSSVTFPDKDVNITNDSIFIGDVRIGRRPGDIYLSPFPSFELDFGEFEANGAVIPLDDPAADVLIGLSDGYKMRWGVYKTDIGITLPNLYDKDGRGRYLRAGNAGMMTDDTSQRVTADIRLRNGVSDNATYNNMVAAIKGTNSELFEIEKSGTSSGTSAFRSGDKESQYTQISIDTGKVIRTSNETSVLDVGMTPVIYLGVKNNIKNKNIVFLNTDITSQPAFAVYSSNPQKDNLSQGVALRGNKVYTLHPYYQGSSPAIEKGVVISVGARDYQSPELVLQTDKGWHEGICQLVIGGDEYLLFSANNPSIDGHNGNIRQTHISKIKVSEPSNVEYIKVFDDGAPLSGAMTAPNISSDYKKITVRQVVYNNGERTNKVRIRVIDAYQLLMAGNLVVDEDFTTDVNQDPNYNYGIQSTLYHNGKVLTLTGGVGVEHPSVIDVYSNGIHKESITLRMGQNLVTDGFWEPEWMFSDGEHVYVHIGINKSPNRKELVYMVV